MSDESAAAAGTWRLGDVRVNRLGFGAMRLTGSSPFHLGVPRDRDTAIAVLRRAVELGVDHIDTAAFYFSQLRSANELINRALAPYDGILIATKVGPDRDRSGRWMNWPRPEELRGQVEENLRQLGRDHLDVVNLRVLRPEPLGDHLGALVELREAGLLRHIGVSGVSAEQFDEAVRITDIVCVQNRFGVARDMEGTSQLLRRCGELGIAFVPFFAIAGAGRESGPTSEPDAVLGIAAAHGVTPAQVRLAWTLALGDHVLAIPGTGSVGHLEENVAAAALRLTDDELARLASAGRRAPAKGE